MKNIKFKITFNKPDDDVINRHKDFDGLMAMYTAAAQLNWFQKLLQNKWNVFIGGVISGALITSLFVLNMQKPERSEIAIQNHEIQNNGTNTQQESTDYPVESNTSNQQSSTITDSKNNATIKINPNPTAVKESTHDNTDKKKELAKQTSISENIALPETTSKKIAENDKIENVTVENGTTENKVVEKMPLEKENKTTSTGNYEEITAGNKSIDDMAVILPLVSDLDTGDDKPVENDAKAKSENAKIKKENTKEKPAAKSKEESKRMEETSKSVSKKNPADTITFIDKIFSGNIFTSSKSNDNDNETIDSFIHRDVQISFITPISTNGIESKKYEHNFSFNILQGYNGAINGFEIGGLLNMDYGYVHGVQVAGLSNLIKGDLNGVQTSGLVNYANRISGFQLAGILNTSYTGGKGIQTAGIANIAGGNFKGFQLAGISNITNTSNDSTTNWKLAGIINMANKQKGGQLALVNLAKKMDGVQIGLINISDTIDGVGVGLLSYSNNGILEAEIFAADVFNVNAALKVGTQKIYNIFAFGSSPFKNTPLYGFGLGIGGRIPLANSIFMDIDGMCWSAFENTIEFTDNNFRLLNQFRVMPSYTFNNIISIHAGPVLNVELYDKNLESLKSNSISTYYGSEVNTSLSLGFVTGVTLNLRTTGK